MRCSEGDRFPCPHCGEMQESPVEDYVIAGRVGFKSREEEQCGYCDHWFIVEHLGYGEYAVDADEED